MLKHPQLTLQRIQLFATQRGLASMLYTEREPVGLSVFHAPDRIPYSEAMKGEYIPAQVGQQLAPFWSTHWFRVEITIPSAWEGKEVHLLWDSNSEAQVWEDGKALQGLTGSSNRYSSDAIRPEYPLTKHAHSGETRILYIEVAVNNLFGLGSEVNPGALAQVGLLHRAEIAVFDRQAWDLYWDYRIIADMAKTLPQNNPRGAQALYAANKMIDLIDLSDRSTWESARQVARDYLSDRAGEGQLNLSAVGHAHIDTAWLWPLAETRRKCVRTFSTAVLCMDEYPDYQFACSQAQQLAWIKEEHPELYQRIKEKVKAGQFIPAGGSWVEPDCNLPSGESLVRQFLYGQRFFKEEFGQTCEEFWEPDVFGYSAALPQILKLAGIRHFLTIKLSWNQFNKLDSHTFWWEGLDGSRVMTHFPPADTYNSMADVKEVVYSMTNYKDLDRSREAYLLFGFGDGGGGPTRAMLEQIQRMGNVDGLPKVEMRAPNAFFTRLEQGSLDLTTWVGELYFELHRGTYTTQANNKKFNRQSENLLHDVEFLAAVAHIEKEEAYPSAEIDRLWKLVLTSQFHDIIPGSSITDVYKDSTEHYHDVLATGAALRNEAAVHLFGMPAVEGSQLCAVNTTSFERVEVVELPESMEGIQNSVNGKPLGIASAPSYGYAVFTPATKTEKKVTVQQIGNLLVFENDNLRAVFEPDGCLTSLVDKRAQRESIEEGSRANQFVLYEDIPNNWDAWDVDIFHLEKRKDAAGATGYQIIEQGPLRASAEFEYAISPNSSMKLIVSLTAIADRLEFSADVEWHEDFKFLKVEFPLNVRASHATYEIQFGHLQRPTHFNTSWDMARFEVVAHRWADLSEADFGVALLNDSKYGHAVHGNIMRLSLLRAPSAPDPEADRGRHQFRYALLPHTGGPQSAGVIAQGYHFNMPLVSFPTSAEETQQSYLMVDNPAVVLDTVKKAEDSRALIVRMFESHGTRGTARLHSTLPVRSATRCNLLEDDLDGEPVEWIDGGLSFEYKPFEIITFKLAI